jgi:hypothetical protein
MGGVLAGPADSSQARESSVHKPTRTDPELLQVKETRIPRPVLNGKVVRPTRPLARTSFPLRSPIRIA